MKDVVVIKRFSDEQWDVETFEWNETRKGLGVRIEDACEFALASEEEVEKYLTYVRSLYNIIKEEIDNEETGETPSTTFEPFPKPNYVSYEFESPEALASFLQYRILANHHVEIPLRVYAEDDFISISTLDTPDEEINLIINQKFEDLFVNEYYANNPNPTDNVISDVFGDYASYTYVEREDTIFIHVPYKEK